MKLEKVWRRTFVHFFVNGAIFGLLFGVLVWHPYFQNLLEPAAVDVLFYLLVSFLILGLPYYFLRFKFFCSEAEYRRDKLVVIGEWIRLRFRKQKISAEKKAAARTAVLSYVVKFFFLPLMLNFLFFHLAALHRLATDSGGDWYDWTLHIFFLIDTLVFAAAYAFEFRFLDNKIRSVDPYPSGWAIALLCYSPFNIATLELLPFQYGRPLTDNFYILEGFRILTVLAFTIYILATLALGWKASNLTNRGIVSTGVYKFSRHPAYAAKNLAWWFQYLPFLTLPMFFFLLGWNVIYALRGLTEERHLSLDPDYREYKKKVKWHFIPKIW